MGMVFCPQKEWSFNACRMVDEPWQHYAKWKKPGPKGHNDSIDRKYSEQANP